MPQLLGPDRSSLFLSLVSLPGRAAVIILLCSMFIPPLWEYGSRFPIELHQVDTYLQSGVRSGLGKGLIV